MAATIRRLHILQLLPQSEADGLTTAEIQQKLSADGIAAAARTIQRDLYGLFVEGGFPIAQSEHQRNRKFWWDGPDVLQIPKMSPDTALAFRLVDEHIKHLLPAAVTRFIGPHVNRAQQVLKDAPKSYVSRWPSKVRVVPRHFQSRPATVRPSVLQAVNQALFEERKLKISYVARGAKKAKRSTISPLGLIHRNATIEVIAKPDSRPAPGRYLLHRMHSAEVIDSRIQTPVDGFNFDEYISEALAYPFDGKKVDLKLRVTADKAIDIKETPIAIDPRDQHFEEQPDGSVIICAPVQKTLTLKRWLLSVADAVVVLEPADLRDTVKAAIETAAKSYCTPSQP